MGNATRLEGDLGGAVANSCRQAHQLPEIASWVGNRGRKGARVFQRVAQTLGLSNFINTFIIPPPFNDDDDVGTSGARGRQSVWGNPEATPLLTAAACCCSQFLLHIISGLAMHGHGGELIKIIAYICNSGSASFSLCNEGATSLLARAAAFYRSLYSRLEARPAHFIISPFTSYHRLLCCR